MFGKLNQSWHQVPAGTELEILKSVVSFGKVLHECRRVDGENLPGPWGMGKTVPIAATFIDLQEI